ncbi:ABC-three component system protein [Xanthobacter sp. DSM 14520]|uniref:ABC-three component system protein n=1 Tax=Xanthobacter autotrophicus (strain ATCC BAA-1158 / Py2) TaxID=78245 RepID=UPI003728BCAE
MAVPPADPLADWITTSSLPGSEGLYFLGTFERRITFYSQQVRAFRLIRALHERGVLKGNDAIAVVGAGAAGVTSALALGLLGYDVSLYDPAVEVLQLQSASPRLLHPRIYEWPKLGSLEKSAGLPFLDWRLATGKPIVEQLAAEFHSYNALLPKLIWNKGTQLEKLEKSGMEWRLTFAGGTTRIVQKVFLAMGFGDERTVGAADTYDYWKERGVGTAAVEAKAPASYLVSGNGDGALTDILNLLIEGFEHVPFTETFLGYFNQDILRTTVLKAYEDLEPEADLEPAFEKEVLTTFAERQILDRLVPKLRTDRLLTINSSGPLLSVGKAAQLNQAMVFAVLHAAKQKGVVVRRSSGKITNVIKQADGLEAVGITLGGVPLSERFNHVILRHGPNKEDRYHPAKEQFDEYQKVCAERFKARPELLFPPTLDADTYTLFFELWLKNLADAARRDQLAGRSALEASTILITWDGATQTLAQRGEVLLEDLVKQCEAAPAPITVHLEVPPDKLEAADLVRLSKASGGKITISLGANVQAAWKLLLPNAAVASIVGSRYPYREISLTSISEYVDASLVRQLEDILLASQTAGKCDTLGTIAANLFDQVMVTWVVWRKTLDASPALRRDFLAWLGNIGPDSAKPWSGEVTELERMAGALVLILATHLGEPLQPALVPRGNLSFDANGHALGSSAEKLDDGRLITEWNLPEHWDVDALILSRSAEVAVTGPDDTILNGGDPGIGLDVARRTKPAIIRNDGPWRSALKTGLPKWKAAVQEEFQAWRERQNNDRDRVLT